MRVLIDKKRMRWSFRKRGSPGKRSLAASTVHVRPGTYVSPDEGLSDDIIITVEGHAETVRFSVEPREWLAELDRVIAWRLPAGAKYERQLLISGTRFQAKGLANAVHEHLFELTVFDIAERSLRAILLSPNQMDELAANIRSALTSPRSGKTPPA